MMRKNDQRNVVGLMLCIATSVHAGDVLSGTRNSAAGSYAVVAGGYLNDASGSYSFVGGGFYGVAGGNFSCIGGGSLHEASANYATIGGGYVNRATEVYSCVGGGYNNVAGGEGACVGGGVGNLASRDDSFVGGGNDNEAGGDWTFVGGGWDNIANAEGSGVGCGGENEASGEYSFVGGGENNLASSEASVISGGSNNEASGWRSTVGGGRYNVASGNYAFVGGGHSNEASGGYAFAGGRQAKAVYNGCFVWGDSTASDISSTAANQFIARASGGVRFYSNAGATSGVRLAPGSGSWASLSDRNAKENVQSVKGQEVLNALSEIPMATWNYKTQDEDIRHMGPMAQDFYKAFGVGEDERTISSVDADGVALAAIQGLHQLVKEKDAEIQALRNEMNTRLARLEKQIENQAK